MTSTSAWRRRAASTYQAVGGGSGCKLTGGLVSCSLGSIPAGTTVQRDVTALGVTRGRRVARAKATTSDKDTDQANNGGSGTVTVKAPLAASVTETFSSGSVAVPIQGNSRSIPLPIAIDKTILDVDALVRLNHSSDQDLALFLGGPGGTFIDLSTNNGGSGRNFGTGQTTAPAPPRSSTTPRRPRSPTGSRRSRAPSVPRLRLRS